MVIIEVAFFSLIKEITTVKTKKIFIDSTEFNISDLLYLLIDKFGAEFENTILDRKNNQLKPGVLLAVNGKNAYLVRDSETAAMGIPLVDGDIIVIGYMIIGG